jgi:hypothetical protein
MTSAEVQFLYEDAVNGCIEGIASAAHEQDTESLARDINYLSIIVGVLAQEIAERDAKWNKEV